MQFHTDHDKSKQTPFLFPSWKFRVAPGSAKWENVTPALSLPGRCVSLQNHKAKSSLLLSQSQLGVFLQLQVHTVRREKQEKSKEKHSVMIWWDVFAFFP